MKSILAASIALVAATTAFAGTVGGKNTIAPEESRWLPVGGGVTFGYKGSEDLQTGYIDSITPLWSNGSVNLFYNGRSTLDDASQYLSSNGLGVRWLTPCGRFIVGANAYWDSISSVHDNDFNQLGLGFEVLSKWVDFRFNYYLPDNDLYAVDNQNVVSTRTTIGQTFRNGNLIQQNAVRRRTKSRFTSYESALEGWNTELGVLVPGLEKVAEVRLFAGYYSYESGLGKTYEGFKGRLEARFCPAVAADLEYWDDPELMGGHWTGGVRVTVPFCIGNAFRGKNPFEGTAEAFQRRPRELSERMNEMVWRSHRVMTDSSEPTLSDRTTTTRTTTTTVGRVQSPKKTSSSSEGEGEGEGQGEGQG